VSKRKRGIARFTQGVTEHGTLLHGTDVDSKGTVMEKQSSSPKKGQERKLSWTLNALQVGVLP